MIVASDIDILIYDKNIIDIGALTMSNIHVLSVY